MIPVAKINTNNEAFGICKHVVYDWLASVLSSHDFIKEMWNQFNGMDLSTFVTFQFKIKLKVGG